MSDTITSAELKTKLAEIKNIKLLDVRRKNDLEADPALIPGAEWKDPTIASTWAEELRPDQEVIIYCVRGGAVSKSTMETLRAKGLSVKYVEGGLAGWKENEGKL